MSQRTLIILAVVLTCLAFIAAEADFWSGYGYDVMHNYYNRSTVLTSFRVAHAGTIELDESQTAILRMSPDARLDVRERRLLSRRRLEVRPDASGRPTFEFRVGARKGSPEDAEAYLASVMGDVVRGTTVGAQSRADRLLAEDGLDRLLSEVGRLDSNAARRIYLETAASMEGLEESQAMEVIRTAGREMTSSSRLRATLSDLAERLPSDWALNEELVEAATSIASSSERRRALVDIARLRGIDAGDAEDFAAAASTIPSYAERGRTVTRIYELEPLPELAEAFLSTADTIESSSERRRVLTELVARPGLPDSVYSEALGIAADIPSSHEKASFLSAVAEHLPASDDLRREYIDAAGTISSSTEAKKAYLAMLPEDVAEAVCRDWIDSAGQVPSSSIAADLLVQSASRCPAGGAVWRSYLDAVERLPASSDRRRAMMALLDREDLDEATLAEVAAVAERSIAATSERDAVLERVDRMRVAPPGA